MRKPWWWPEGWHAETWVCSMRIHVFDPGRDPRLTQNDLVRSLRCDAWGPTTSIDDAAANKPAYRHLKEAARRLVTTYANDDADDLFPVWEAERPFDNGAPHGAASR